jgi:hypothetical protein
MLVFGFRYSFSFRFGIVAKFVFHQVSCKLSLVSLIFRSLFLYVVLLCHCRFFLSKMERPTRVRKQPSRLAEFELGEDSGKLVRGGNGHVERGGRGGRGRKVGGVVRGGRGVSLEPGSFSCSSVVCMGCRNG